MILSTCGSTCFLSFKKILRGLKCFFAPCLYNHYHIIIILGPYYYGYCNEPDTKKVEVEVKLAWEFLSFIWKILVVIIVRAIWQKKSIIVLISINQLFHIFGLQIFKGFIFFCVFKTGHALMCGTFFFIEMPWSEAVSIAKRHIMLYMYIGKCY